MSSIKEKIAQNEQKILQLEKNIKRDTGKRKNAKLLVKSENTGLADTIKGDANADGEFSISDVVTLQKWLLNVPDTELIDYKAVDLCEDGKLDVFDLCMMKNLLTSN